MNLKCKINEEEYPIVQGIPFSDEYNEMLDSGTIKVSHVYKMQNLRPYDDVIIWDDAYSYSGYGDDGIPIFSNMTYIENSWENKEDTFPRYICNDTKEEKTIFFKHLLVDSFTNKILNLCGDSDKKTIYQYDVTLFSETKGLEVVQLPNLSITEPLKMSKKKSVWEYMNKYVDLYSPRYKRRKKLNDGTYSNTEWEFVNKYKLDPKLEEIFGNCYSPDFDLNGATLKDLLAKFMIVKDMIPYVKNGVIYALDQTVRKTEFDTNENHVYAIVGNMSSSNYCDSLRTTYSEAISDEKSCRYVENLGFRNSDNALMTLENMRLETQFPIYKINSIKMCYYKKYSIYKDKEKIKDKTFLCKQDITPFVKLNTERNLLSQDWEKFNKKQYSNKIEDLAQFKMMTIGYDIGSKYIDGWGTTYTYPMGLLKMWDIKKSYIENIFTVCDRINPTGELSLNDLFEDEQSIDDGYYIVLAGDSLEQLISPIECEFAKKLEKVATTMEGVFRAGFAANAAKFKSFVFQIDYQGFYNGAVVHSKDIGRDDIVINNNPNSGLTMLEKDGLYQKEQLNRFGNQVYTISARYDDISQLQPLGSVLNLDDDQDIIIYHREYTIYDNMIQAQYIGSKDYVLKNYHTSVYARHRTWSLMNYNEAVTRAENRKIFVHLDKNELYYEKNNDKMFLMEKFENKQPIEYIVSLFEPNNQEEVVNLGYILYKGEVYLVNTNIFINGNSLCFNLAMPDSISAGMHISVPSPTMNNTFNPIEKLSEKIDDFIGVGIFAPLGDLIGTLIMPNVTDDYTGSLQDWYPLVDDIETGFTEEIGFYLAKNSNDILLNNKILDGNQTELVKDKIYSILFALPKLSNVWSVDLGKTTYRYKELVKFNNHNFINNEIIQKNPQDFYVFTYRSEEIINEDGEKETSYYYSLNTSPETKVKTLNDFGISWSIEITTDGGFDVNTRAFKVGETLAISPSKVGIFSNVIGNTYKLWKDNKEKIDMTYQIEPITSDKDILFSQWFMKLSDLNNRYKRIPDSWSKEIIKPTYEGSLELGYAIFIENVKHFVDNFYPIIYIKVAKDYFENSLIIGNFVSILSYDNLIRIEDKDISDYDLIGTRGKVSAAEIVIKEITKIDKQNPSITFKTREGIGYKTLTFDEWHTKYKNFERTIDLKLETIDDKEYYTGYIILSETYKQPEDTFGIKTTSHYRFVAGNNYFVELGDIPEIGVNFEEAIFQTSSKPLNKKIKMNYNRNMYICTSKGKLKNTLVYDKYSYVKDFNSGDSYKVNDLIAYDNKLYKCVKANDSIYFDSTEWVDMSSTTYLKDGHLYKLGCGEDYWNKIDLTLHDWNVDEVINLDKSPKRTVRQRCMKINSCRGIKTMDFNKIMNMHSVGKHRITLLWYNGSDCEHNGIHGYFKENSDSDKKYSIGEVRDNWYVCPDFIGYIKDETDGKYYSTYNPIDIEFEIYEIEEDFYYKGYEEDANVNNIVFLLKKGIKNWTYYDITSIDNKLGVEINEDLFLKTHQKIENKTMKLTRNGVEWIDEEERIYSFEDLIKLGIIPETSFHYTGVQAQSGYDDQRVKDNLDYGDTKNISFDYDISLFQEDQKTTVISDLIYDKEGNSLENPIRSIQYWYANEDSLEFVFGVNINDEDIKKEKIEINMSLLSSRDERVFDENHNLIGNVWNFAEDTTLSYGTGQFFKYKNAEELNKNQLILDIDEQIEVELYLNGKKLDFNSLMVADKGDKLKIKVKSKERYGIKHILLNNVDYKDEGIVLEQEVDYEIKSKTKIKIKSEPITKYSISILGSDAGLYQIERVESKYANAPLGDLYKGVLVDKLSEGVYYGDKLKFYVIGDAQNFIYKAIKTGVDENGYVIGNVTVTIEKTIKATYYNDLTEANGVSKVIAYKIVEGGNDIIIEEEDIVYGGDKLYFDVTPLEGFTIEAPTKEKPYVVDTYPIFSSYLVKIVSSETGNAQRTVTIENLVANTPYFGGQIRDESGKIVAGWDANSFETLLDVNKEYQCEIQYAYYDDAIKNSLVSGVEITINNHTESYDYEDRFDSHSSVGEFWYGIRFHFVLEESNKKFTIKGKDN